MVGRNGLDASNVKLGLLQWKRPVCRICGLECLERFAQRYRGATGDALVEHAFDGADFHRPAIAEKQGGIQRSPLDAGRRQQLGGASVDAEYPPQEALHHLLPRLQASILIAAAGAG